MTSIQELRKYRVQLSEPYFNSENMGISVFDVAVTFVTAIVIDYYFKLSSKLPGKNKMQTYYLSIIPLGIVVHHLLAHIQQMVLIPDEITFLNKKIISLELNVYKVILLAILAKIAFNMM